MDGVRASWPVEGPDEGELKAVLASGLHDGLHEDDIEDMERFGHSRQALHPSNTVLTSQLPVAADQKPTLDKEWFAKHYPKLKPADLAEHYRSTQLEPRTPMRKGTLDQFDAYRQILAERVRNANAEIEYPQPLTLSPPPLAAVPAKEARSQHRAPTQSAVSAAVPRMGIVAILICFSVLFGGAVGMGLAEAARQPSLLLLDWANRTVSAVIPSFVDG